MSVIAERSPLPSPAAERWPQRLHTWWAARLRRKIMLAMLAASALASILLLLVFFVVYRSQLEQERTVASMQINRLLEAALENAMLKRDVPGLQQIVSRLGQQPGILGVRIINPAGIIRFTSDPLQANLRFQVPNDLPATGFAQFTVIDKDNDSDREVLRSIKPVFNREPCTVCHGALETHPINGILVVDYDAHTLRIQARNSALGLTAGAALVMLFSCVIGYRALHRYVIAPVDALANAAQRLSEGDHGVRVPTRDDDELAQLGQAFNRMAENLAASYGELQAQQRYLRSLLDSLPDAVRVISPEHRVLAVNDAYCKLLGLSRAAALEQKCYRSNYGLEEPCPPTLVLCPLHALDDAQPVLKYEQRMRRADGSEVVVETVASRILLAGPDGERPCVVESLRDLSTLARYSQEQRLSEIGMLAAGIAHEIHNPLASVRLAVQSLARSADGRDLAKGELQDGLTIVDGEIDRCIEVTHRLLLLCRHPDEVLQCVDVNHAMHDAAMLLGYEALAGGIEQTEDYAAESPLVYADPSELRMMIFNIVQNAHHAMPEGGRVDLRSCVEEQTVLIEIADTGVGIAPENLGRIFQPFYSRRADGALGTGLGLSIVRSTVTRYHGHIEVDSTPGRGTRFRIRLPLAGR
ncbi:ATP-binding protein [Azonexus sp.]|jgi:PAS domain S-box-containing protein|uniref:ATP-binding protein n=1 Tax=Azonexus sp. TaxID=1872668 RepID=UPI0028239096|nr:ATP-binding protein [Azonexus sp.]MDR1995277.1 HAMP domain-containing protein [Azonexus sp.]